MLTSAIQQNQYDSFHLFSTRQVQLFNSPSSLEINFSPEGVSVKWPCVFVCGTPHISVRVVDMKCLFYLSRVIYVEVVKNVLKNVIYY